MRNLLLVIMMAGLISTIIPGTTCNGTPQSESEIDFEWNSAFGLAVLDWLAEPETDSITIEVDWSDATWGLGAEILLKEPINLKDVAEIEIEAYATYNSPTNIYAMVATPDDANLSFPSVLAYPVTSVPDKFTFPIDRFVGYKPDTTSKNFKDGDWQRVDRVKFILTKPANYEQERESIVMRSFRIVYKETIDAETPREEPVLSKTEITKPSKVTENSDVEDVVAQLDERQTYEADEPLAYETDEPQVDETEKSQVNETTIGDVEVVEEQEITYFQSLNELMKQYPPDGSVQAEAEAEADADADVKVEAVAEADVIYDDPDRTLIFDQLRVYEDGVCNWRKNSDGNKFFLDLIWKNKGSGFAIDFHTPDPVKASGEWYLIFSAQTINRSKPRLSITAYNENEYDVPVFLGDEVTLKNKLKTFRIPLKQKAKKGQTTNGTINKIKISCVEKKSNLIKEDIVVIKDLRLVKKQ